MSKVIFVTEKTWDNCVGCPLSEIVASNVVCKGDKSDSPCGRDVSYHCFHGTTPIWCPFKDAPERQLIWDNDNDEFAFGYNDCLRDILGDEEDEERDIDT